MYISNYGKLSVGMACTIVMTACVDSSGNNDFEYHGAATPAAITATNGEEIIRSAYASGDAGSATGTLATSVIGTPSTRNSVAPRLLILTQALLRSIDEPSASAAPQPTSNRALYQNSDTVAGDCGGTAHYNVSIDNVTYDFSGTATYTNFCNTATTINGSVTLSGHVDSSSGLFDRVTFTFSPLGFRSGSDAFSATGTIFVSATSSTTSPDTISVNMKINDNGKVFWAENISIGISQTTGGELINMRGRYNHPAYGYVYLTTETPLLIASGDSWPSTGVLIASGAHNTRVRLTATSNTTYEYEVDSDGALDPDTHQHTYETQQAGVW